MPNQLRFEGPTLEDVLADVRERFGPDVNIVEANRLRKGGIGGFFAREAFEVLVDADQDRPADAEAPAAAPRPRSLLDLVDAVDDGPGPSLSTEGQAFADVLERIARSTQTPTMEDDAADEDAPFRSFAEAATSERAAAPAAVRPAPVEPTATQATVERPQRPLVAPTRAARGGRALDVDGLARLGLPDTLLERTSTATERISALLELAESFPRPVPLTRAPDTVIAVVGDRSAMETAIRWVQDHLELNTDDLVWAAKRARRALPPERHIGERDRALALRQAWRRRTEPVLVAVDSPVALRDTAWTRHVLDALEPNAVWAAVDAQRKPEDIVAWCERIGGVDAIAVDRTEETTSPAAVLTTRLPVSLVDGHQATPARWAALLDERLLAA